MAPPMPTTHLHRRSTRHHGAIARATVRELAAVNGCMLQKQGEIVSTRNAGRHVTGEHTELVGAIEDIAE